MVKGWSCLAGAFIRFPSSGAGFLYWRMVRMHANHTPIPRRKNTSYTYNAMDDELTETALSGGRTTTYTYDHDGNLLTSTQTLTGNVWTCAYDYRNRMTGAVEKTSGGTTLEQVT